jgi:Domain of unknown function (DUF4157)
MELRFQHDFGDVRVHSGRAPAAAAEVRAADAFTSGQRIVFAAGRYRPQATADRRLLTHELAHTLHQRALHGPPPALLAELAVPPVSDPLEREADAAADHVAARRVVPTSVREFIQRQLREQGVTNARFVWRVQP